MLHGAQLLGADRASLFLVDEEQGEVYSRTLVDTTVTPTTPVLSAPPRPGTPGSGRRGGSGGGAKSPRGSVTRRTPPPVSLGSPSIHRSRSPRRNRSLGQGQDQGEGFGGTSATALNRQSPALSPRGGGRYGVKRIPRLPLSIHVGGGEGNSMEEEEEERGEGGQGEQGVGGEGMYGDEGEGGGGDEIRLPLGQGIVGHVGSTGERLNIPDAYQDPRFDRVMDGRSGFRTKSILAMAVWGRREGNDKTQQEEEEGGGKEIVGVVEVMNKKEGTFTEVGHVLCVCVCVCMYMCV